MGQSYSRAFRCIAFNACGYPPNEILDDPAAYGWQFLVRGIDAVTSGLSISRALLTGRIKWLWRTAKFASTGTRFTLSARSTSLLLDATDEVIKSDGVWRVDEFAWQIDAILFWDRFQGRWLRGTKFHYPERPETLPALKPLENWPNSVREICGSYEVVGMRPTSVALILAILSNVALTNDLVGQAGVIDGDTLEMHGVRIRPRALPNSCALRVHREVKTGTNVCNFG